MNILRAGPHLDQKVVAQAHRMLTEAQRHAERRDFAALSKADRDFHELLYKRCENTELCRILNERRDQMQFAAACGRRGSSPWWDLEHVEHLVVLTALEEGDIKTGADLSTDHIERVAVRLFSPDPVQGMTERRS